jgi:uncharacterized membrane protein YagU involved in acid resistance
MKNKRKNLYRENEGNVLKGLIAGLVGGLVASWTMNKFQALWIEIAERMEDSKGDSSQKQSQNGEEQEPATTKAASAILEGIFNHKLTEEEKKVAEPAVHYAVGGVSGAVYGAAAELMPSVTFGAGIPFGTVVWLVVDEGAVPILGLSKSPTEYPVSIHVYALASHFVYGLTTEVVRRAVRRIL